MNAKRKTGKKGRKALPSWKPHLYYYPEQRILRFQSEADLGAAIELLWTEELRELPHATPDGQALVVPAEAVPYFTRAGLKFTSTRLTPKGELSPEEISQLRFHK